MIRKPVRRGTYQGLLLPWFGYPEVQVVDGLSNPRHCFVQSEMLLVIDEIDNRSRLSDMLLCDGVCNPEIAAWI